MNVYVARDNGADCWIGAFTTLEAAQAAAEAWVLEYGVNNYYASVRVQRDQLAGWGQTWDLIPTSVWKLRVTGMRTKVEVAEFNVDQPS